MMLDASPPALQANVDRNSSANPCKAIRQLDLYIAASTGGSVSLPLVLVRRLRPPWPCVEEVDEVSNVARA
jgi:hypothetical protein